MSKFTPGPWVISGGSVWAIPQDGSNLGIAQPWAVLDYVSMGERNANAALIAAAPDMYEALKEAEALYTRYGLLAQESACGPWINAVRAALAKADGKPTRETQ